MGTGVIILIVVLVLAIVLFAIYIRKELPKIKCGMSKEGHEWVSNAQTTANTGCSCLDHSYVIIYCKKCGKVQNVTKRY